MFKIKYLLLNGNAYNYQKDGQTKSGISITYVTSDKLSPIERESKPGGMDRGVEVVTERLPYELFHKLSAFPAVYEVTLAMATAKDSYGRVIQKIQPTDIDFVGAVELICEA
jgi:hypothetical protein